MTKTCFNCERPATTDDHVPPKVFFPAKKDTDGQDLRKNLITAPACAACNNSASTADEYVAYMIATSHANNHVAMNHVAKKVVRALKRSDGFRAKFLDGKQPVLLDGQPTVALQFDFDTFNEVMVRSARGLHFARTGSKLTGDLMAISPFIIGPGYPAELWAQIQSAVDLLPWEDGPGCENPEVFRYRFLPADPVFDFEFYGGFHVLVNRKFAQPPQADRPCDGDPRS